MSELADAGKTVDEARVRPHHPGRARRLRPVRAGPRGHRRAGRPGLHRGRPAPGPRHGTVKEAQALGGGRRGPAQRPHQDPRHGRGPARDQPGDRLRRLGQRDPDLLPRPLPRGDERLPHRLRAGPRERPGPVHDPVGGLVLRLPRRHRGRQAARRARHRRGDGPAGQGRRRQRPPRLPGLRGGLLHAPVGVPRGRGSPPAAPAVGVHGSEGPGIRRHALRHRARRRRHRQHDAREDPRGDGRPRRDHRRHHHADHYAEAAEVLDSLERLGISYADVTAQLERDGVDKFEASWDELLAGVARELEKGTA